MRISDWSSDVCSSDLLDDMNRVQPGDVLVADMTDPDWEPVMKRAAAIVTNRGGRTCHAAIIARELGVSAVVGTGNALDLDRKSAVSGKSVSVRVALGGRRSTQKKHKKKSNIKL